LRRLRTIWFVFLLPTFRKPPSPPTYSPGARRGARSRGRLLRRRRFAAAFTGRTLQQPIQQRALCWVQRATRRRHGVEGRPVHFRECGKPTRVRRPLHLERVAPDRLRIAVSFERPSVHSLAPAEPNRTQRQERPAGRQRGFLSKLAHRRLEQRLTWVDLTLGYAPSPVVSMPPERPTRVHEQHLEPSASPAIHQQPSAPLRHGVSIPERSHGRPRVARRARPAQRPTQRSFSPDVTAGLSAPAEGEPREGHRDNPWFGLAASARLDVL
jgi:hypothetical protein